MKKYFFVIAVLTLAILTVMASENFSTSLKTCSPYSDSGIVETEGMKVSSRKEILGWENNKCVYKESINFAGINSTVTCKLTKSQIKELTSVMDAYELVRSYSDSDIDTSSLTNVQNNPIVKVWGKYMQDSSTCTIQ